MEVQQTFIIEASQQNSIEAPTTNNYSAWTNRIQPTLLRKGDYLTLNTAIVSQRGASNQNNIEFTDEYNNATDNLQSNFTLLKIGYYLCNNNVNSCPLPFRYARRQSDFTDPSKKGQSGRVKMVYDTDRFTTDSQGNSVVNQNYLLGEWHNPLTTIELLPPVLPNPNPTYGPVLDDYTCDALNTFENRNPEIKIDGGRFAKVGNEFNGWNRDKITGVKNATKVDLLSQDIPLHIQKGFKDASSVGDTLTKTLQTTNEPYSDDAEYAVPESKWNSQYYVSIMQTKKNPRFNGYCMKSIPANLQKYKDSVENPLYNNLCVKSPYTWKYGTQLLCNADVNQLTNNMLINNNYFDRMSRTRIAYPVILWSSWNGAPPTSLADVEVFDNYETYSPHFTDAQDDGGDNVIEWSGFTGVMSDYNDYYAEIRDYNDEDYIYGQMIFKNGTDTYRLYEPTSASYVPFNKAYRAFIDNDNVAFDRITAWNPKNTLGHSGWSVKGLDVTKWNDNDFTFVPANANLYYFFAEDPQNPDNLLKGTITMTNDSIGTSGGKLLYGLSPDIGLEANKKYKIRFQSILLSSEGGGTSSNYRGKYYIYYKDSATTTQTFQIDEDKNGSDFHEITWTQGTANTGIDAVFLRINNNITYGKEEVKLVNFQILEASLEEGDTYTITDMFEPNTTNGSSTKIYKLRVNSGQLRNEKFDITDSTLFGGIFNRQYTAYDRFTCYKSGNDIIAFDGINSGDHDHPVIMLNRNDPTYDYIIYNQYGSKVWRIAQISKVPNDIVSGNIVGTIQNGNETSLRNPFRTGQQYYDFSVHTWHDPSKPLYDFSTGNTWTNVLGGGSDIIFNMTAGTDPTIGAYDFSFSPPASVIIVYCRYNPLGIQTATSGECNFSNDGWARTWSYDVGTQVFTQVVGATTYTYTPAVPIPTTYNTITIASAIADPLPTIVAGAPVNDTFSYFASFQAHVSAGSGLITFYLAMNTAQTDTDLQGKRGTLIWDDGGVWNATTWDWDGLKTINLNAYGGMTITSFISKLKWTGPFGFDPPSSNAYFGFQGDRAFTAISMIGQPSGWFSFYNFVKDDILEAGKTYTISGTSTLQSSTGGGTSANYSRIYQFKIKDTGAVKSFNIDQDGAFSYTWTQNSTYPPVSDMIEFLMNTNSAVAEEVLFENIQIEEDFDIPLTNIIQYDTAQRNTINGIPYDLPVNGKQYGYSSVNLFGDGLLSTNPHLPLPVSNNNVDEVYLGIADMTEEDNGYQSGGVYENIDDTSNPICQWSITFNDDNTCDLNFGSNDGAESFLLLENSSSNIVRFGWQLIKSSKYNSLLGDQTLTIQDGEDYYTGSRGSSLTGTNGRIPNNGTYNFPHDTGSMKWLPGKNLDTTHSNMPQSTMLMTNLDYNVSNLEIIKNYFRYTEIYDGDIESSRAEIVKDVDNFYANFQCGRTDDNQLDTDATQAPYKDSNPAFQYYMRDYGKMGTDDSDATQFTDDSGEERKGSNKNFGCVCDKMKSKSGHRTNIDVFTRWKGNYTNRLIATNRLRNKMTNAELFAEAGYLYGKEITEFDFQSQYPDLYNYAVNNNVGVYPYLLRNLSDDSSVTYTLAMAFETYRTIDRDNPDLLKIQDLSWFGFSPSFLDNDYITAINTDTPFMSDGGPDELRVYKGFAPNEFIDSNMNYINIGSAPVCQYDTDLNRFQFQYLHTPFQFNEVTGTDTDLGEEVAFLNSDTLMITKQGINENNLLTPQQKPVHLGVADAQCGIYFIDMYGQKPSNSYVKTSDNGLLITRDNYNNTLFYTLGFSYYDIKPLRFKEHSFNNRFNENTFNTISGDFRKLGTSPFTTNSAISIADSIKTNIFTGVHLNRNYSTNSPYDEIAQTTANSNQGTPEYYLGYNSLLATTIKTTSANMTSRSVMVQLQAPFYRVYCDLPLDTMSYLSQGSLSCVGYMTKNYQSQSFIYSFASDYGAYLTRDILITNLRTEIRNPKGLLVSSLDPNSAIFYKVVRNIQLAPSLPIHDMLPKKNKKKHMIRDSDTRSKKANENNKVTKIKKEKEEDKPIVEVKKELKRENTSGGGSK